MSNKTIFLALVLALYSASSALAKNSADDTNSSAYSASTTKKENNLSAHAAAVAKYEPLQEALPALPEELRLGSKYVPGTTKKYIRGYAEQYDLHEWQIIPTWLAGDWRSTTQIRYVDDTETNGETSSAKNGMYLGTLLDKKGNIWHYTCTPFKKYLEGANYYRIENVVYDKMNIINPQQVSVLIRSSSTEYRKFDNVAFRNYQQEGSYIYTTQNDGTLVNKGWCAHFDEDGVLRHKSFDVVQYKKQDIPFHQIEQRNGIDLRKDFRDYLKSHNRSELIPE
jgi:hypothetical protein